MIILEFVGLVFFFACGAFFSAAETAMTGLPRLSAKKMAEENSHLASTLEDWLASPGRLLTTIIVSSNFAVIAFSFLASALTYHYTEGQRTPQMLVVSWACSILISVMTLLAAEIAPKVWAKGRSEEVALSVLPTLRRLERFLGPLARLLLKIVSFLARPFGRLDLDFVPIVTEEELKEIVTEGEKGGVLEKEERDMIHSIMEFGETVVREVMVPRTGMACISIDAKEDDVLDALIEGGYSRMPVYKGHFDNIVGILYSKDFLSVMKERDLILLYDVIRPAYFVPETKKVSELFREFKRGRIHMAIVVDEYGGTAGMVTLEDLLEEIVGEIRDEYDTEEHLIEMLGEDLAVVDARAALHDLNSEMKLELPEEGSVTVGGFITGVAQRVPRRGETINFGKVSFQVLEASSRRLSRIRVRKEPEPPAAGEGAS